jgi:phosphate/sulfate permease
VQDVLVHSVLFVASVAGGANATVILATRFGFPIFTTHALLGAMTGSALVRYSAALTCPYWLAVLGWGAAPSILALTLPCTGLVSAALYSAQLVF